MKKKKLITILATILVILVIVLIAVVIEKKDESVSIDYTQDEQKKEIPLVDNLIITSIDSYSGFFVEDGSDEEVNNIISITVKNTGIQTLQYAEATLICEDITAEFAFSTLRPGETMVVLEKNRLEYPKKIEVTEYQIQNIVYFEEEPGVCEDKFEVSAMDGAFNIKNISGEDLFGNVAIYYKNKQDDIYFGGITYRVVIEGGIEKDGIRQVVTEHFKLEESEVMFVDYTEME